VSATRVAARPPDRGLLLAGLALVAVTAAAWAGMLRGAREMPMPGRVPSLAEGMAFTGAWGVMMAAMMLPGAAPMILLYRTVSRRLAAGGERAIPPWAFAGVYLAAWTLLGVPVYAA
jgi:predicted metal-binding membrane protein